MIHRLFAPAIWLMSRLSYRYKLGLLALIGIMLLGGLFLLHEDVSDILATQTVLVASWTGLLTLWIYLFLGSYMGIQKAVDYLSDMVDAVARGDLIERSEIESRDEFGALSHSMNLVVATMQHNLKMLREYQGAVDNGTFVNRTDPEGKITYVNAAFERLSGYTLDELRGATHSIMRSSSTTDLQIQLVWDALENGEIYRGVFENVAKDGSLFSVKSTIIPIFDEKGKITEYMAIMSDVTALKEHERQLEAQLYTDDMTGLANRNALNKAAAEARDAKLMVINVDGFSTLNAIYGERTGDEIIIQLGKKLQTMIQDSALKLYRLSGDEYAILADEAVSNVTFHEDVIMLSHYLNPLVLHSMGHEIRLRVSIGAVIASRNDDKRPLMSMAAIAMKEAKKTPYRAYCFYSEIASKSFQLEANLGTVSRLDHAIKNDAIVCYYQPIYNVERESIEYYESLMRLVDSEDQVYMPSEFIDVAKGAQMYAQLTRQVLRNVLETASNNPQYFFSVNIDVEDIQDMATTSYIIDQLRQSTCAERITFELVESRELENNEMVEGFLARLKSLGCRIAIDDFGSGYSNYGYLVKLGIDIVKIDGSLIVDVDKNDNKRRIVASIINIAHELGIKTVAEYVHSQPIFDRVVELGVDYVQGSHIAIAADRLHH